MTITKMYIIIVKISNPDGKKIVIKNRYLAAGGLVRRKYKTVRPGIGGGRVLIPNIYQIIIEKKNVE